MGMNKAIKIVTASMILLLGSLGFSFTAMATCNGYFWKSACYQAVDVTAKISCKCHSFGCADGWTKAACPLPLDHPDNDTDTSVFGETTTTTTTN